MAKKNFNTNYFLKKRHIQSAFDLVEKQIKDKGNTFKTIELEIYRKDKVINDFDVNKFYKKFIKKDIFYNKRKEFYTIDYLIPKGFYGVRTFNYLSFEQLILYYSIGFYFYDLIGTSYDKIERKKDDRTNIHTFYGGKINFKNPKTSNLLYYDDYRNFNKAVNENIINIIGLNKKAVIIKLDIQNFYKNINFNILLKILENYSIPSNLKKFKFDSTTTQEIKNLFLYVNKADVGLPLFAQNIISNFLSYIYLYELDNYIQNLNVSKEKHFVYARYVDDFYLIYKRNKGVNNEILGNEIFDITTKISKFLAKKLNLPINQLKTRTLIIKDSDDFDNFIKKEKIISLPDEIKKDQTPDEKLMDILNVIRNLKIEYKKNGKAFINTDENNKLNEIFSKSLNEYVNSSSAKRKIERVFKNWNPILTLANTPTLMFLIKQSASNNDFRDFLFDDIDIIFKSPQYLFLLEKFLLNNKITQAQKRKIIKAEVNNSYFYLIKKLTNRNYNFEFLESIDINISDNILMKNDSLNQQVKMLVLAEIEGKYNLAFNHLLNIFHYYCYIVDKDNTKLLKNYNQTDVTNFLDKLGFSISSISFSMKFFDRRNKNNISHAGEKNMENWIVNKDEFNSYKKKMNTLLIKIEKSL